MASENERSAEQDKEEAAVRLLRTLREKLLSGNISKARSAAHNLSWLQEDGLAILKEALFGNYPRTAKQAAAYGLRKVKGRMTKMALDVLEQGLQHRDRTTRQTCEKSLALMRGESPKTHPPRSRPASGRRKIRELSRKGERTRLARPKRSSGDR